MIVVIGFLVVFVLVVAFSVGVAIANGGSPANGQSPGRTPDGEDCKAACARWDNARQSLCNTKSDEAAAVVRAEGARARFAAALASATSLAIAAAAAFAAAAAATATIFGIPAGVVLTGIAIGLTAAASAASLAAAAIAGELAVADDDVGRKASVRRQWEMEVSNARMAVNQNCPPAEANACLGRPSPC